MAGNANSGRRQEKPFRDALLLELNAAGKDHKLLRQIARALLTSAAEGKMDAIKEVGDRIDGKAVQQIDQNVDVTTYVAALPSVVPQTDEWLKQQTPKLQ